MARHFPHWLRAYCEYTRHSEPPIAFHFWTGVWTIAGALRRRVWRNEVYFDWTPNFYIILVAPPGIATKSTTIAQGRELLEAVPDIHFGPDSGSWQGVAAAMEESFEYFKYVNGSAPPEMIPMNAISIAASELGTFLKPDDEQAISFLTDMWDGKRTGFTHRLKHVSGAHIKRPWINLIGATTPSWIQRNIPDSMIEEGLLSRTVFVYGDKKRHRVALPSQHISTQELAMKPKLIEDLKHISNLVGQFSYEDPVWMEKWYDNLLDAPRPAHMTSNRFAGYFSRKQTHLVKLAMVLSVCESDDLVLRTRHFEEAEKILVDNEFAMNRVFEVIGGADNAKHVAEVLSIIRSYKWITEDDLYRLCYNTMRRAEFKEAVQVCIMSGLADYQKHAVDTRYGLVAKPRTIQ